MSSISMMGMSLAATAGGPSTFFEAEFQNNGSGGVGFAAMMGESSNTSGIMCGICEMTDNSSSTAASATTSTTATPTASGNNIDLGSLFTALFNMLEGDPGNSSTASTSTTATNDNSAITPAASNTDDGTDSSDDTTAASASASGSNWMTQMFTDMQKMFDDFETAATQASQVQISA